VSSLYSSSAYFREHRTVKTDGIVSRVGIMGELLQFLWHQKLWWLIPMILALVLFAALLVIAQGSAVAPFIYTLF
jgi:hypothetical protein